MSTAKIQKIFQHSYAAYVKNHPNIPPDQAKAAIAIMKCKTGELGYTKSYCESCGNILIHNSSCRNRNCPNCQAVNTEIWVDKRSAEVIDAPYFHVVFTLPHQLNPLIYCNQKLLYGLFHKCCAETLLELSKDRKYLGATPGIIQVLHTWNQELSYHVHMHCIISGGGLTADQKIRKSSDKFFIPIHVLRDKFKGKFLHHLNELYISRKLAFSTSCLKLRNSYEWTSFRNLLYEKDWCPFIKQTFNGFGNAIDYLGRYTHKIAISNNRVLCVGQERTTFTARGRKATDPKRTITLTNEEFIRRFLMHVLPAKFQKIRYYGFLNNRMRSRNLKIIFKLQGYQRYKRRFENLSIAELIKAVWNVDVCTCPKCGARSMIPYDHTYGRST